MRAEGEVFLKVVTLGGNVTKEETHTVTIRSETAAFDHVKERLKKCLAQGPGPDRTYPACFNQAYKELTGLRPHPRGGGLRPPRTERTRSETVHVDGTAVAGSLRWKQGIAR